MSTNPPLFAIVRLERFPFFSSWSEVLYKYNEEPNPEQYYQRVAFKPINKYSGGEYPEETQIWSLVNKAIAEEDFTYNRLRENVWPGKKTTFYDNIDDLGDEVVNLVIDLL